MSAELNLEVDDHEADSEEHRRSQWQTIGTVRTILAVVHNVTAATRLLDVLPLIATDRRVQILFSIIGSSAFTSGTEEFLRTQQIMPIKWESLDTNKIDLAISASYGGNIRALNIPIIVVPHGMGYNKYLAKEPRSQGAKEPRSQGAKEPRSRYSVFLRSG